MREVRINNNLVDIQEKDVPVFAFQSPVFYDVSKIVSNGTFIYKIPLTQNNINLIDLANNIDIETNAPFMYHRFDEYRDGLPIIYDGRMMFVEINQKDFEFAVIWGTKIGLQDILEKNIRDIANNDCLNWDENFTYLKEDDADGYGFVYGDFGQGYAPEYDEEGNLLPDQTYNKKYVLPSVNAEYIMQQINSIMEVPFTYSDSIREEFKKRWIPLFDRNANQSTWNDSFATFEFEKHFSFSNPPQDEVYLVEDGKGYYQNMIYRGRLKVVDSGDYLFRFNGVVIAGEGNAGNYLTIKISIPDSSNGFYEKSVKVPFDFSSATINNQEIYFEDVNIKENVRELPASRRPTIYASIYISDNEDKIIRVLDYEMGNDSKRDIVNIAASLEFRAKEVPFGAKYPVVPNLPDMTCIDFLKSLLGMFGLFAWYRPSYDSDIRLISIDDIYGNIPNAKDLGKMPIVRLSNITHKFNDYGRKNYLRYADDDTVSENGEGILYVDNETLKLDHEVVKLKFSASDNKADFAYLPVFVKDNDGAVNHTGNLKPRILNQGVYRIKDVSRDIYIKYKKLIFDKPMSFGGNDGILARYYSTYQNIIRKPRVIDLDVYLSSLETSELSSLDVFYYSGKYWMPIVINVEATGLAHMNLIMLPDVNGDNSPLKLNFDFVPVDEIKEEEELLKELERRLSEEPGDTY